MPGDDDRPDVSVLIVGFRSKRFLAAALDAIGPACARHRSEVRFIDNGEDGSNAFVAARFPWVEVVPSRGNVGFAAGCNLLAHGARGRWLLLLNPDTIAAPGSIDLLLDAARSDPGFAILGGLARDRRGRPLAASVLQLPTPRRLARALLPGAAAPLARGGRGARHPARVEAVSGGFMLVERRAWEALGGFDERFFLYGEELDLCRRAAGAGWKIGFLSAAEIVHDAGSGAPRDPARMLARMRGSATYYRKHFGPAAARLCLVLHWAGCAARLGGAVLRAPASRSARRDVRAFAEVSLFPWRWCGGYPR